MAKYDSNSTTILVILDENWYHNPNPHNDPFPDSHIITHFKADTIIYKEPTIPPELRIQPRTENRAIQIVCIHHKNKPLETKTYTQQMQDTANTLGIPEMFCQIAPPTPLDTSVNRNTKWTKLTYPHPRRPSKPNQPMEYQPRTMPTA